MDRSFVLRVVAPVLLGCCCASHMACHARGKMPGTAPGVMSAAASESAATLAQVPDSAGDADPWTVPNVTIPVPPNHRVDYNFNVGWKFVKHDVRGAESPGLDDRNWKDVSLPHTYNDVDTYTHVGPAQVDGELGSFAGVTWYRKHFTLGVDQSDRKVFVEFEGVRQRATVYINGEKLGLSETGFVPFGFDLTAHVKFGQDNVLALQCDNSFPMTASGSSDVLGWHNPHWHPNFGGIYRNATLHVTDKVYVTLPLLQDLQTSGIYVHADHVTRSAAPITIEAQLKNDYAEAKRVEVTASVIDNAGVTALKTTDVQTIAPGQSVVSRTQGVIARPKLWAPGSPNLYSVQVSVALGNDVVDVGQAPFGVRAFEWTPSGFTINGRRLKLHGWGQKPTNSWAALGAAVPDWLHDYSMRLMRDGNGNFVRWGHCAGAAADIRLSDKYGMIVLQPGVDAEAGQPAGVATGDTRGAAWKVRTDAFKATLTYFRNNPSILIWEGANKGDNQTEDEIRELRSIKDALDPTRAFTMRSTLDGPKVRFLDVAESTIGTRYPPGMGVFEGEYNRKESPRRVWDAFSPPHLGGYRIAADQGNAAYAEDSEQNVISQVADWDGFYKNPAHSGGANWHFSDEPTHRRVFTDVTRNTGEVDAVRLPKESFFALQAMWSDNPAVRIVGHWTYPAETAKDIRVVSNCDAVELLVNGTSLGKNTSPKNTFLFTFPNVTWKAGAISAVGYKGGARAATDEKRTAGPPAKIRLTATTGPGGLWADGADYAMIDVEVVDASGNRVPTDEARVDFAMTGPGVWLGGYNSGSPASTGRNFLDTEGGINRVFVRSTRKPGPIRVTARRPGLSSDSVTVNSIAIEAPGGLTTRMPPVF
jgi:beta-galactosidase